MSEDSLCPQKPNKSPGGKDCRHFLGVQSMEEGLVYKKIRSKWKIWQQAASYHRATRASLPLFFLFLLQSEVLREVVLNGRDDRLDKFEENNEVLVNSKLPPSFRNLV